MYTFDSMNAAQMILTNETVKGMIPTDEGVDLAIEIEFQVEEDYDRSGCCYRGVTIFGWTIAGKTSTPSEIIQNSVEKIIIRHLQSNRIEFKYYGSH